VVPGGAPVPIASADGRTTLTLPAFDAHLVVSLTP
jgi:hypothetical protein